LPNEQSEVDDFAQFVYAAPVDGPADEEPLPDVQLAMLEELNNLDSYDYDTSLEDPFNPLPTDQYSRQQSIYFISRQNHC
jgi:hypothetical protein